MEAVGFQFTDALKLRRSSSSWSSSLSGGRRGEVADGFEGKRRGGFIHRGEVTEVGLLWICFGSVFFPQDSETPLKKGYCLFVFIRINSCRVRVWSVSCSCLIPQTRIKIRVVFVFAKFVSCKFVSDTNTRHGDTDCQTFGLTVAEHHKLDYITTNITTLTLETNDKSNFDVGT
ncbi:hypothetical protein LXL04_010903 [Taraxacum kok-saghyz]